MPEIATAEARLITGLEHKLDLNAGHEAPLLFLVHGRAGNFDVMWTFKRCLTMPANIIAPQAYLNDRVGGYSWWDVEDKVGGREAVLLARDRLSSFISKSIEFYSLKPRCILGFGFSQGAGLLSALVQESPDKFAGIALLAGFVIRIDQIGKADTKSKIFMGHGTNDQVITLEKAKEGRDRLVSHGFDVEFIEDPVGHKVGSTAMRELKRWTSGLVA